MVGTYYRDSNELSGQPLERLVVSCLLDFRCLFQSDLIAVPCSLAAEKDLYSTSAVPKDSMVPSVISRSIALYTPPFFVFASMTKTHGLQHGFSRGQSRSQTSSGATWQPA